MKAQLAITAALIARALLVSFLAGLALGLSLG